MHHCIRLRFVEWRGPEVMAPDKSREDWLGGGRSAGAGESCSGGLCGRGLRRRGGQEEAAQERAQALGWGGVG